MVREALRCIIAEYPDTEAEALCSSRPWAWW